MRLFHTHTSVSSGPPLHRGTLGHRLNISRQLIRVGEVVR